MSAPLDPAQLRRALGDCTLGREIVVLEETTSTNDSVLERASPDVPEGLVVFAEHQPPDAASAAIGGNRHRVWDFGSLFCCDRRSTSVNRRD
jgi:hypothetical protein